VQANVIELVWHREYNVVVLNGQGALHQVVNPECLPGSLTFWAMSVAAAIVTVTNHTTVFAHFFVSAKGGSAATGYFAQYPVLQRGKLCFDDQICSKQTNHIGKLKLCPHFLMNRVYSF
jgi:hypothetical protein